MIKFFKVFVFECFNVIVIIVVLLYYVEGNGVVWEGYFYIFVFSFSL